MKLVWFQNGDAINIQKQYHYQSEQNNRSIGASYEQKAAEYLEALGFRILERNYYCKLGELDLICMDTVTFHEMTKEYLVFVEVKYRHTSRKGYAVEAVGSAKQKKIMQCAQVYMKEKRIPLFFPVRFDVVAIDGNHITLLRNAFGGM